MRRSTLLLLSLMNAHHAFAMENPCHGPGQMLNIVDRPNNADSACSVPAGHVEFEMGYQHQTLRDPSGYQQNYPSAEFRLGLPRNSEIFILAPNYIQQSIAPSSGFTQTSGGLKHQLWYNDTWLVTIEGLVNLPDGSAAYGNRHMGEAFNAIISYNLNSRLNLTLMAGASSSTEPRLDGGQRFNSFNPDLVLTWSLNDKSSLYAEVWGQSKTGYGEGSGFNADVGILYLVRPNVAIDFSGSQHVSGFPGGFKHYLGAGLSVMM